jgi:Ca-activated chloride channel family protein
VLGRSELTSDTPAVSLELPETVDIGEEILVGWRGPGHPGDHLTFTPADADPTRYTACVFTSWRETATLPAPTREGAYVVRYISGVSGRPLGERNIEVAPEPIILEVPDQVAPGRGLTVKWTGPSREGDYLILGTANADDDEYLSYRKVDDSGAATLTTPGEPGQYEVRYISGADDRIRARASLEVVAVVARLVAPATVRAGTRFEVEWAGPDAPGDVIAVARAGRGRGTRATDWVYTSAGNPVNLAAPFRSGTYELRYISGADLETLASVEITVE